MLLAKYIGIPLLQKLGAYIVSLIQEYFKKRRIKKEQKAKEEAVDNAKTPEDIRTAHRNNSL